MDWYAYSVTIEFLSSRPEGMSFNRLSKLLEGRVSRILLAKVIERLIKDKIVEVKKDRFHKQKKIFKLNERTQNIISEVNELEKGLKGDLSNFHLLLKNCSKFVNRSQQIPIKKYIEYKVNSLISRLLYKYDDL